jgi:hypothetical protein
VGVDIVVPSLRLVIEYDGQYWHNKATSWERDRRKSERLEAAGWTVVRVRDHLALVGAKDVVITTRVGAPERAVAVFEQLVVMGFILLGLDCYRRAGIEVARETVDAEVRSTVARRWTPNERPTSGPVSRALTT